MPVLVFVELHEGKLKKSAREVASYAAAVAKQLDTDAVAVSAGEAGNDELATLGQHGVKTVLHVNDARLNNFDSKACAKLVAAAADKTGANVIVLSHSFSGKALAPRISARLKAGLVTGVVELPDADFTVKKSVFSGKGYAHFIYKTDKKIISLNANSFPVTKGDGTAAVETLDVTFTDTDFPVKVIAVHSEGAGIPLPEADIVVSGGRGLKGPENWGMIEDLAKTLGAATACSRPVSDVNWRPHHEHVGQTGLTISPNLYIAIGISGAIQHLAGVSGSKVIVVINSDPEAPFYKAADYGIVGDAFQIVPKLNEAFKKYFAGSN